MQFYGCGWQDFADTASAERLPKEHELYFLQEYLAGGSLHQMVLKAMTSQVFPWPVKQDA